MSDRPKKPLRTLTDFSHYGLVKTKDIAGLQAVVQRFSLSITDHMHQLIDPTNPDDPIAKQFVPSLAELAFSPIERKDPIGDDRHSPVKGIIHRYPDRCLFMPVHVCPVYCRFCFRREKVGTSAATLTSAETEKAIAYIQAHPDIWEIILTGGDPLILKPAVLKRLMDKLTKIHHVDVIRIHTRIPVVDPHRIDAEMIAAIKCNKAVYVVLHANHPKEFTPDAILSFARLIDAGIPMLSQTTLLKGVNDTIDILSMLMRCFVKYRIKPYYLHHGDLAQGTQHFRTTVATGQHLMKQLRGRLSGLCQPTYMLDIPGGYGKVPIGPTYICPQENAYCVEDYQGYFHKYREDFNF